MRSLSGACISAGITLALLLPGLPAAAHHTIWGADYFPNVPLVSQDGKTFRFFDDLIKDKVVAINFIYTSCPDACPLETAKLRQVQEILGDRMGRDVFMYSITIDPRNDTPKVLKAYAAQFQVGPGWLFLTGKEADIDLLRAKLGLFGGAKEQLQDHNLSLIIGNQATGQWMKSSPYENPYLLATQLGSWLHNWKLPSGDQRTYAEAPVLRPMSTGEDLFRTRCASCHSIGAEGRVGPDLLNVTQSRERDWLVRWMAAPDRMLAAKDPLALALMAQYHNLPMPNLRLNDVEIAALLDYLEAESRHVEYHRQPGHEHPPLENDPHTE